MSDPAPDPSKIGEQINKVRDLDSETTKPRLQPTKPEKTVKKTTSSKPNSGSNTPALMLILTPYLRNLLTGKSEPVTSTYTPSAVSDYPLYAKEFLL